MIGFTSMNNGHARIHAVPTNIITGFLGVGKTTAILQLLNQKPKDERWAVLVNEFGEIGVDGNLLEGGSSDKEGVFIREVPGGCMCCASGLPMQVALNQLLSKAKPDRLLIEPTGLGHPAEVLQVLSSDYYRDTLALHKTVTLIDARKICEDRYTSHDTFNQQIMVADIIIGNKLDLCTEEDKQRLESYVSQFGKSSGNLFYTQHGKISLEILSGMTSYRPDRSSHQRHIHNEHKSVLNYQAPIPESGFIRAVNQGEGFVSSGWRFSAKMTFERKKLLSLLTGLSVERMKAVFITEDGIFGYNLTTDALTEVELDDCFESTIEIIATKANDNLEQELLMCLTAT